MPDFTEHKHPTLAVPCSDCSAAAGASCKRPSGHRAAELHRVRRDAADRAFVAQHSLSAEIRRNADIDEWLLEASTACAEVDP